MDGYEGCTIIVQYSIICTKKEVANLSVFDKCMILMAVYSMGVNGMFYA
ncbi:hypothetical protein AFE_0767 [Acidithiobacillus ferrooxidans ATCC 23270]|uniref:Uncharacterized protein n=1 Tax=Acidithiobacillus ferrooxidans (strain ATCC 23270 / DSM 14882 / CIP 104768 / NCIMB 8455) TaxID=243159 RepID=B7J6I3_ACIF2|nr:hypothetical protein AFE_0767 [Acidithiobacillus ferrooxidans ATCC 23270]EGQ62663.1 hypothetical protein GGI1_14229 [Acidithiobacillus sp. GGI-221]